MAEDDGIGFEPKKASGGMGMKNVRSRVSQMHGTIFFDSSPGKGCTVTIEIPITSKS
jgi:two-component system NarL family sensor kinase